MRKSAFISDLLFTFFLSWLFSLCLFRFLAMRFIPALLLSVLCAFLATCAVGAFLQSKRKSFFLKRSDEAQKQRLLTHLALLADREKTNFFEKVFQDEECKKFSPLCLHTKDAFYFLRFRFSPVTADDVATLSRLKTSKRKIILCDRIEESAVLLAGTLGVEYQTAEGVYALVKKQNALPAQFLGEEKTETKRKLRFRLCFSKSNSRRFFTAGALVLLTSLVTPFPYYYFLFGSLLLLLSLLVRIFGK